MVCNFHRLICFAPRGKEKKQHNYFAVSCEELYQLKNVITAML